MAELWKKAYSSLPSEAVSRQLISSEPPVAIIGEDSLLSDRHRREKTSIRDKQRKTRTGETSAVASWRLTMHRATIIQRVCEGRFVNSDKEPQLFGALPRQDRAIAFQEWELPQDATAFQDTTQ